MESDTPENKNPNVSPLNSREEEEEKPQQQQQQQQPQRQLQPYVACLACKARENECTSELSHTYRRIGMPFIGKLTQILQMRTESRRKELIAKAEAELGKQKQKLLRDFAEQIDSAVATAIEEYSRSVESQANDQKENEMLEQIYDSCANCALSQKQYDYVSKGKFDLARVRPPNITELFSINYTPAAKQRTKQQMSAFIKQFAKQQNDVCFYPRQKSASKPATAANPATTANPATAAQQQRPTGQTRVVCGANHAFVVREGALFCFGDNQEGQLGVAAKLAEIPHPLRCKFEAFNARRVDCGYNFTFVSATDSSVWCFGDNQYGQLGLGHFNPVRTPARHSLSARRIFCGGFFAFICAAGSDDVFCFGTNEEGELGIKTETTNVCTPAKFPHAFTKLFCGGYHAFAYDQQTQKLVGFGSNIAGQLGLGADFFGKIGILPVELEVGGVRKIACGEEYSCILLDSGKLLVCGKNGHGQLGLGHLRDIPEPVPFPHEGVRDVVCGSKHTIVLLENGDVLCFGSNVFGQLGNTPNDKRAVTSIFKHNEILKIGELDQVFCGQDHTIILTKQNVLFSSGFNEGGQLGLANTLPVNNFQEIKFP